LPVPDTDRRIIWPLMNAAEQKTPGGRPGFFAVHIDCRGTDLRWAVEQQTPGT
jgi:hypothetical protein